MRSMRLGSGPEPTDGDAARSIRGAADHLAQLVALEEDPEARLLVLEVGEQHLGSDYEVVWVALMKRFQAAGRSSKPVAALREYAQAISDGGSDWKRSLQQ